MLCLTCYFKSNSMKQFEDDIHKLALSQYLKAQPEFTNLVVFSSAEDFENANSVVVPDVIELYIHFLKKAGIEFIPIIKSKYPSVTILMMNINNYNQHTILADLNKREKEIVHGIVNGLSYKLIAIENNISINTVRKYIKSVYKKFKINSKAELSNIYHHHLFVY